MPTLDASTPARATTTAASVASPSFNPPAGSVIVVAGSADHPTGNTPTLSITYNGTQNLTWQSIGFRDDTDSGGQQGKVQAWWAFLAASRTGMIVTMATTVSNDISMRPYVWNACDTTDPIGAIIEGSSALNTLVTASLTSERDTSIGMVCANESTTGGAAATSSDTTFSGYTVAGQISGGAGYKTLGVAGSGATFSVDAAGTGAIDWNYLAFEILGPIVAKAPTPKQLERYTRAHRALLGR